jgi:putative spermidine/putrescine transport system substrate-binding protein
MNLKIAVLASVAVLALAAFPARAQEVVRVQTWGGALGDSFQKNIVEPFEKETGIKVELSYGMSVDALAKVRGQAANPQIDVAMMGQVDGITLWQEGLTAALDPKDIPNLGNLISPAVYKDDKGSIFYVGMYGYVFELVYRTDKIKTPPTCWKDLWKDEYKGEVMFPPPGVFIGYIQAMASRINGGSEENMEPGWAAMKALAPNIGAVFNSDSEAYNLIASGEASIGPVLMFTTIDLIKAGVPVARVSPCEGSPIAWDGLALVKNSPNPEGAKKLVNFMLQKSVVEAHVNAVSTIPAMDGIVLKPELAKALPSTPEDRAKLTSLDDATIAKHKAEWIARWDREIVPLIGK